jgi:hypothetical protein
VIDFIAQTTQQAVPVVTVTPGWGGEISQIISAIGGVGGIIAIILALRQAGVIGKVQEKATEAKKVADLNHVALVETREKVNEVADKNSAEIAPLAPMPKCPADEGAP